MWFRRLRLALACLFVAGMVGAVAMLACGGPPDRITESAVFHEHRVSRAALGTKLYGEDCSANGSSACVEGICLHFKPGPDEGWACSRHCSQQSDCAGIEGARCRSIYPGGTSTLFCVPPQTYTPAQ